MVYTDAYHNHANNETIVGHTTLAPGESNRLRSSCQYVDGRIYFGDSLTRVSFTGR